MKMMGILTRQLQDMKMRFWLILGIVALLAIIIIPTVVMTKKN